MKTISIKITPELREAIAAAIYDDGTLAQRNERKWGNLTDDKRIGWLGDADRVLSVLDEAYEVCASEDGDDICIGCVCWKQTRENCG